MMQHMKKLVNVDGKLAVCYIANWIKTTLVYNEVNWGVDQV